MNTVTCNFNQYESDLTISLNQRLRHEYYQVKYQESSIGFENLAYLQSIEQRCNHFVREKGKLYLNTKGAFRTFKQLLVKQILVNGPWRLDFMISKRPLLLSWLNT